MVEKYVAESLKELNWFINSYNNEIQIINIQEERAYSWFHGFEYRYVLFFKNLQSESE
ncbi:MAG: hypothetical protein QXI16_03015 [Sulfolobaceae archaeon]